MEAEIMATKRKTAKKSTRKPARKGGKQPAAVSADSKSADRGEVLGQVTRLLNGLQTVELVDILAVLRRYSVTGTLGMYSFTAEDLVVLDGMVLDSRFTDMERIAASDLAIFIVNQGTTDERAEAFAAVFPIARRIYERWIDEQKQTSAKA
jgi:hypothetical protein